MQNRVTLRWVIVVLASVVSVLLLSGSARSDRCSCPPPPTTEAGKQVYEPAQRAVVLWTGSEELLFLSTDLSSPQEGPMREVLALPASPTATVGEIEAYGKLTSVLGSSRLRSDWLPRAPRSRIDSPLLIGDLSDGSPVWSGVNPCKKELLDYRADGFAWAVVNTVNISHALQSFSPIEYRFASRKAFYPLRISVADLGETQIDLVIISRSPLVSLPSLENAIEVLSRFQVSVDELRRVSTAWADFMATSSGREPELSAIHVRIRGDLASMKTDFFAE